MGSMSSGEGIRRVTAKFTRGLMKALGSDPHRIITGQVGVRGAVQCQMPLVTSPEMLRHEQMGIFTFLKFDRMVNSEFQQLSGDWAGLTSDESVLRRETLAFVFVTLRGPNHGVGISFSFLPF